jgi:hypothetical protein
MSVPSDGGRERFQSGRGSQRRRFTQVTSWALIILGVASLASGCSQQSRRGIENQEERSVFGFRGSNGYVAGLIIRRLIDLQFYTVNLGDLQLVGNGESDLEEPGLPLEPRCIVRELKVRAADKPGMYKVSADVRSPLQFDADPRATTEHQIKAWTEACDCSDDQTEVKGQCFGRRFAASLLTKLRQISGNEKKNLSAESIEQIVRGAGRPYIPYDRLLIEERGLIPGDVDQAGGYLKQYLKPGDELCFSTATYSLEWEAIGKSGDISQISQPAASACFPWLTLMQGIKNSQVHVGIDPLRPFRPPFQFKVSDETGEIGRERKHLLVTPDQIPPENVDYAILATSLDLSYRPKGPFHDIKAKKDSTKDSKNQKVSSYLCLASVSIASSKSQQSNNSPQADSTKSESEKKPCRDIPNSVDITLPGNIKPFVAFWIRNDKAQEKVRVGTSLLNLVDQRFSLSSQVLDHRSLKGSVPSRTEKELIRTIVSGLTYLRRSGLYLQSRQCPFAWCKTFGPNALIRG